jgi:hypothetical protein
MCLMVKVDGRAAREGIVGELRMSMSKAGELSDMAALALAVGKFLEIGFVALMFLMTCGAG